MITAFVLFTIAPGAVKGLAERLLEVPGPPINGQATTSVMLLVAAPKDDGNVSKDILYIGKDSHLPLRREQFVGGALVKTETFKDIKLNNGFKPDDFS